MINKRALWAIPDKDNPPAPNQPKGLCMTFNFNPNRALAAGTLLAGAVAIHKAVKELKNDTKRRQIVTRLHETDPVLSGIPPEQLMEWYATIYHFAPKFSLDYASVREVLQNFVRFGKVDVNTIKMLAETEKATAQAKKETKSWSAVLGDVVRAVSFGGGD